jgi:hypothetical protein
MLHVVHKCNEKIALYASMHLLRINDFVNKHFETIASSW